MSDWRPSSLGVYPAGQMPPSPAPSPRQWQPLLVKVPEITVYFWVIKLLTTALGESTSDFLVYQINPYVAVGLGCFGLVAALMVAVFGTMAADVLHVVLGVSYVVSTVFFSTALAVVFVVWYWSEHTLS